MTWQQFLRFHPIFKSKPTSGRIHKNELASNFSSSMSYEVPSLDSTSTSEESRKKPQFPFLTAPKARNTLALHETALALVVDSEIRLLDLTNFKRVVDKSNLSFKSAQHLWKFFDKTCPYQIIQAPALDLEFDLIQLEFDPFGRFLCLLGLRRVVVVDLHSKWLTKVRTSTSLAHPSSFLHSTSSSSSPSFRATTTSKSSVTTKSNKNYPVKKCKGYELGLSDLMFGQYQFLQCAWSPHGLGSGTLLILSEDGVLRMYDLDVSTEVPWATYSFLNTYLHAEWQNPWSPDADACRVVSFCLGDSFSTASPFLDQVWHPFTVYGVMKNGDVYALCPVIPSTCMVDTVTWEAMHASIDLVPLESPNYATLVQFLQHLKSHCTFDQDTVTFQPPVIDAYTLSPQPVVVEGPSSVALESLDIDASDILCLPSSLVLVSYVNGHVDVYAFDQVLPEWGPWIQSTQTSPSISSYCASMALQTVSCFVVQTLDLETAGELRFLQSPVNLSSSDTGSVHDSLQLDQPNQLASISNPQSQEEEDSRPASTTYLVHVFHAKGVHQCYLSVHPSLHFQLYHVLHTVPMANALHNPITGCQCVLDHLLNPTLMAKTVDNMFAVQLYPFDLDTEWLSLSSPPASTVPQELSSLTSPPPALQPDLLVVPSLISIRTRDTHTWTPDLVTYLHSVYHQVAVYLHQLNQFSLDLRAHMHWQQHTLTMAKDTLQQLPMASNGPPETPLLHAYEPRVKVLLQKTDILLQLAYDHVNADRVSEREQQYFDLVREMVPETQSLKQRGQKLIRYYQSWVKQFGHRRGAQEVHQSQSELSEAQAVRLQRILSKQYQELNTLQNSLLALQISD